MTLYNSIGQGYNRTRKPDKRIVDTLVNLLNLPLEKTIADVGAGTGNYSNAIADQGYQIIAIEPSKVMQNQAIFHHNVSWLTAKAEQIPLPDNSVDGAIIMLALHHFSNINLGIQEVNRIVGNGKMVIFAFEQNKIPNFWLADYFPYFIGDTLNTFPNTKNLANAIKQITNKNVEVIPFLLPADISDLFAAAGWCRPEIYLDAEVRNGISSFAKMPQHELTRGISQLTEDIDNGNWNKKYGNLKNLKSYDAGYRIIVVKN